MTLLLAVLLVSSHTPPVTLPAAMRGTWADGPEFCEEELTNGAFINDMSITFYGGTLYLADRPEIHGITVGSSRGIDLNTRMRFQGEGKTQVERVRLTLVGEIIYLSRGEDQQHFTAKNRMVRCKVIRKSN